MSYKLIISEYADEKTRDVGENVFFDDLLFDYKVYIFYYPAAMPDLELESKLKKFGEITGKNLFVNIGRLNDPNYDIVKAKFEIKNLPVIIVTAINTLASIPHKFTTAYIRIDSKNLLNSHERLLECLQKSFNLFIGGEISKAIVEHRREQINVILLHLGNLFKKAFRGIWNFIDERDLAINWMEGTFEIKRSIR